MKQRHLSKKNLLTTANVAKVFAVGVGVYLMVNKDISFQFNLNARTSADQNVKQVVYQPTTSVAEEEIRAVKVVHKSFPEVQETSKSEPLSQNLANTYSNLTYRNEQFATKESAAKKKAKREKQLDYIQRFAKVAKAEMKHYGIPASITIAQGLIESNCGESKLAEKNNNHFGIKCFSKTCKRGHCRNYEDDTHKDFFRIYKSVWESFRAHSVLLQKDRYKFLYNIPKTDYKAWAHGLKKAGYATDPNYALKLIDLIEELELYQLDK